MSFAVPWEGMLLLGTTDTLHDDVSGPPAVTAADVDQVLREASVAVKGLSPADVRATFAGLRVLPIGDGGTATARRETVYSRGSGGMVSVAGGKLTTYRRIALDALDHLRSDLGLHRLDRQPRPLPGAAGLDRVPFPAGLPPETRTHLLQLYGSLAADVLAPAAEDATLLEPLVPGRPDLAAQALYARTHEWAITDEDVLRRRTTAWLAGPQAQSGARTRRLGERVG